MATLSIKMPVINITIPDGEFCSDNHHLGCIYEHHEYGLHYCTMFKESIGSLQTFKSDGNIKRAFKKCNMCLNTLKDDTGNGLIVDEIGGE